MLSARLVALQGFGATSFLVAVQGLWDYASAPLEAVNPAAHAQAGKGYRKRPALQERVLDADMTFAELARARRNEVIDKDDQEVFALLLQLMPLAYPEH